ncbi:hypothetical protein, partial [Methylacidimicrobium cyclopophantes]|uniref:hypothetical protein n=1 Tax=Methylacidimicrobium cyclopophantes TaxID=1041766 RepID=UPI0015B73CF9
MRSIPLAWLLFVILNLLLFSGCQAKSIKGVVLPFSTLHRKTQKLGSKPRHLWTYGEFTAWSPVQEGVFAAAFPKLLSLTVLQKIAPYVVFPTEPIVQIAICEADFPIPGLKQGKRFVITEEEPAEVLEMLQSHCFYARLRLSAPPKLLGKPEEKESGGVKAEAGEEQGAAAGRGKRAEAEGRNPGEKTTERASEKPLVLHFSAIARAWKERGTRPSDTWTYGRFFIDAPPQEGLFIGHESGLATRRIIEGLLASAVVFPFGERYDTAIFSSRFRHLQIERKSVIEIDKRHPARVVEIVPAGGLLVRLDLEAEPQVEGPG